MEPFHFSVQGTVHSRESHRPLHRLLVRAYDKDLFFDDHLGDALPSLVETFGDAKPAGKVVSEPIEVK